MGVNHRRLKLITFTIGGTSFECQLNSWTMDPGSDDGDRQYTYCPNGTFVEETDDEPSLELKFFSDWRSGGISDYLWSHPNEEAEFVLDHHPDIPGEHVRWTGKLLIKPAPAGGDVRETEMTEVTLQVLGNVADGTLKYERVS
ncbi:hypothetical protein [Amycolatopsis sp. CA-230715]|uniref:hypothetical protein n=1 Tax=Amycolatopsis sp. CA-230715 TaxID=2745196 RepID=UPI001C02E76D|nr:hypothetical protein [Amycolatopsis sp. CA-230715]QWF81137.1 hypothetical protein HUW46_04563 [Amycolatopsis sp. CA-230715]